MFSLCPAQVQDYIMGIEHNNKQLQAQLNRAASQTQLKYLQQRLDTVIYITQVDREKKLELQDTVNEMQKEYQAHLDLVSANNCYICCCW